MWAHTAAAAAAAVPCIEDETAAAGTEQRGGPLWGTEIDAAAEGGMSCTGAEVQLERIAAAAAAAAADAPVVANAVGDRWAGPQMAAHRAPHGPLLPAAGGRSEYGRPVDCCRRSSWGIQAPALRLPSIGEAADAAGGGRCPRSPGPVGPPAHTDSSTQRHDRYSAACSRARQHYGLARTPRSADPTRGETRRQSQAVRILL
mmetsp:Transcript_36821/g.92279  ORF Transcript_36821/g.92279 Transcript_36821/m.92279 type:complete len:202 (+) Transcript_36821:861-1466(+)